MSKQTRTVLKGYFQTGDIPTESQYVDFIDSKLNLSENNTGNIQLTGNITASSNISSSATVIGNSGSFGSVAGTLSTAAQPNVTSLGTLTSVTTGDVTATGNSALGNAVTDTHTFTGNITASNNISSSATIIGNSRSFGSVAGTLSTAAQPNVTSLGTLTSLTSTGNVSSSFTSTGSLGMLKVQSQLFVHEGEFDIGTGNRYNFRPSSGTGFFELSVGQNRGRLEYENGAGNGFLEISTEKGLTILGDSNIQLGSVLQSNNQISISGSLTISGSSVIVTNLPTSDPSSAGQLYNDGGTLKISAG